MFFAQTQDFKKDYQESPELSRLGAVNERLDQKSRMIQSADKLMRNLVESCPIPMWIKDTNLVMRFINSAYCKIYDVERSDYIGHTDKEIWGDKIAHEFQRLDNAVLNGEKIEYNVERVPNRAGFREYDHLHIVKFPIYDGPKIIGIAGIVTGVFP